MRLKTLGELSLEGSDFKQSRPLLLLAYLCLEGAQERRHLAELFWPQSANAVRNLTTVLSRLNKVDAALVVEGHKLRSELACDAKAFLQACEQQDDAAVIELYRERFLEGFYLKDLGEEPEEWLYHKRETIATKVRLAKLDQAERKAQKGQFQDAAKEAEAAYLQAGAGEPTEADLERIYKLLLAGDSQLAHELNKEALSYGLVLSSTQENAQKQLGHAFVQAATGTEAAKATKPSHTLPKQATPFVGRHTELEHLHTQLHDPNCSLLSLIGPGGMGKTRLSLALAEQQVNGGQFEDGVYFDSFVSVPSVEGMLPAMGDALGLSFSGQLEPKEQLFNFLAEKNMLLILDNLEHLLEGV